MLRHRAFPFPGRGLIRASGSVRPALRGKRDPVTVAPETSTPDAIELMRREGVACLPVVKDDRLVGIVSEHDFTNIAAYLLGEDREDQES